MKTPSEWAEQWPLLPYSELARLKFIAAIQHDARRNGMTEALELHKAYPPSEHYECTQAILTARDNLKLP